MRLPLPSCAAVRLIAACGVLAVAMLPATASAQLSGDSGSGPGPTGGRPQSTRVGFFELLKSGGEAFLELFAAPGDEPTVDDPKWDSTEGPRSTVMTFLEAMTHVAEGKTDALDRAFQTLPPEARDEKAAIDLLNVFDRLPKMSPGSIPGRQEMDDRAATRFELFPRGIERDWAYTALDGPVGGEIVLAEGEDGEWRFTRETIDGAAELLDSMRSIPPRPRIEQRGKMFHEIVGPTFTQTAWTGWLFLLAVLAAAVFTAWLLWKGLTWAAEWLRDKQDFLISPLLTGLRVPAVLVLLTVAGLIATSRVHVQPTIDNFRWKIVETLLVLAGTWVAVILIELLVLGARRFFGQSDSDPYVKMATSVFRQALRVIVGVLLGLFVLQNVFDWNVTTLIGGVGLLALAMSLAAKDAVANLFGAATIFISRPFLVGDWVIFQKELGTVENVELQATSIRLLSGELWSVPNMLFVDTPVENLSRRRYLRRVLELGLTYDTTREQLQQAMDILREILSSEEIVGDGQGDLDAYPPEVNFTGFDDFSLGLRADYWYLMDADGGDIQRHTDRGYLTWLDHCTKVNLRILERFNEAGLNFAFPTQTVHMEGPDVGEPLSIERRGGEQRPEPAESPSSK